MEGKKIGDILPVVLIHASGKTTTANLTLSAKSVVTDLGVAGIFNAKGEAVELNDASKVNDVYLVLDLKDQYGEEIVDTSVASGLTFSSTNTNNLTVDPSLYVQEIAGEDKLVIKLSEIKKAGSTSILLISTTNGKSLTYTVDVAATATADKVVAGANEIVVKDEEVLIPLTVTDKEGNVITDRDLLSSPTKGIKVGNVTVNKTNLVVKDGEVFYKTTFTTEGVNVLLFSTATNPAPTTYTANVKAAVIPTLVTGFKKPLVLAVANGAKAVTVSDVVVEDQYGRVIPAGHTSLSGLVVNTTLVGTSDKVSVASNSITPIKNGTAKVKLALAVQNGTIDSSVEQTVTVTDGKEYTGYEVSEIGLTQSAVAQALTVKGQLNGGTVTLTPGEYYAEITGGKLATPQVVTAGTFTIATSVLNDSASATEIDTEFTVKVTVTATGEVLEQKFTVSKKPAVTSDFFFTSSVTGNTAAILGAAKTITDATIKSGLAVTALKATDDAGTQLNVYTTDQYGNEAVVAIPASATVTIVPSKPSEVTITGNGTTAATVALVSGVTKSNVTYKVVIGNKTVEIPVLVTIDPVTASATYAAVTGTAGTALASAVAPSLTAQGSPTVTYAVKTGSALPTGLTLNTANGEITGTPTTAGTSTAVITYTYVNEYGTTVTKEVTVTFTIAA